MANPWTNQAIMNDMHLGDRKEAAKIAYENGNEPPVTCKLCGGEAWFKGTVSARVCFSCGAVQVLNYKDGKFIESWR